jgi:Clp amino terminal domain, pathogenicity island component
MTYARVVIQCLAFAGVLWCGVTLSLAQSRTVPTSGTWGDSGTHPTATSFADSAVVAVRADDSQRGALQSGRSNVDDVFEHLNADAGRALFFARRAVSAHGGQEITLEHILLGILAVSPVTVQRLMATEWTPERLEQELIQRVAMLQKIPESSVVNFSSSTEQILVRASADAKQGGSITITLHHLLLALVEDQGAAGQLLRDAGVTAENINQGAK